MLRNEQDKQAKQTERDTFVGDRWKDSIGGKKEKLRTFILRRVRQGGYIAIHNSVNSYKNFDLLLRRVLCGLLGNSPNIIRHSCVIWNDIIPQTL